MNAGLDIRSKSQFEMHSANHPVRMSSTPRLTHRELHVGVSSVITILRPEAGLDDTRSCSSGGVFLLCTAL